MAQSSGPWLQIDYGTGNSNRVNAMALMYADATSTSFTVQAGNDGATWTSLANVSYNNQANTWLTNKFVNPNFYRYYRL